VVPLRKFHQLIFQAWSGAAVTYSAIMHPSWRFFALFDPSPIVPPAEAARPAAFAAMSSTGVSVCGDTQERKAMLGSLITFQNRRRLRYH
jgi:hypothetical protein